MVRIEKKGLLCDSYFPLNNSGSKLIYILEWIRIKVSTQLFELLKEALKLELNLKKEKFKSFIGDLPNILVELYGSNLNFDLDDYKLCCVSVKTCKFVSKRDANVFELYIMNVTLSKRLEMKK